MLIGGAVLACVLAACGSSAGTASSDPLSTALSYIPPASPVADRDQLVGGNASVRKLRAR